jgi:hypothetical protein
MERFICWLTGHKAKCVWDYIPPEPWQKHCATIECERCGKILRMLVC